MDRFSCPVCFVSVSRTMAAALSCCPRNGRAVLLCFHPQGCNAGGLPVRLTVQLIAIDARADASAAKEAAHVSLPHVAAGTRDAQEFGDSTRCVGMSMGGHARRHRVTWHYAGRHR